MHRTDLQAAAQTTDQIRIFGLVDRPFNITYAELLSLPTVSEVVNLLCVWNLPNVTFEWTGIPLFYILTLAQVKPEAREVVFRASDGFSSSLLIEDALKPHVLLALEANGTLLTRVDYLAKNIQGGFRIVVPCKYGYKWVTSISEIEVVDYDYNGTYESTFHYTEQDAIIPGCVPPPITPPIQAFNLTFGTRNFQVETFTNISISEFNFDYVQKEIDLNITVPQGETGFADIIIPQSLLKGPFTVSMNGTAINTNEANVTNRSFIFMSFPERTHSVKIIGTEFSAVVPEIMAKYDSTAYVGEVAMFNASGSVDNEQIVSYEWNFGDNATGRGATVSHTYTKEGTYQVKLNVTDNDGLSSSAILIVSVINPPSVAVVTKVSLATTFGLLLVLFAAMLLQRNPKPKTEAEPT